MTLEDSRFFGVEQTRAARLWEAEGRKCHWCGVSTVLTKHTIPNQATEDHVIPRALGGSNQENNVVSACLKCNARRCKEQGKQLPEGALMKGAPVRTNYTKVSAEALMVEQTRHLLTVARHQHEQLERELESLTQLIDKASLRVLLWVRFKRRLRNSEQEFWEIVRKSSRKPRKSTPTGAEGGT